MIELHQFPRTSEGYNLSPFCLKVQAYLIWNHIPYKEVYESSIRAPKKKLPYIVDKNVKVADSTLILRYLKHAYKTEMDADLTPDEEAQGHMVCSMLEEKFYFSILYSRWIDEVNWSTTEARFFEGLPFILRLLIPAQVRKKIRAALLAQGLGRHSKEEIYKFATDDIKALSAFLGRKTYTLGEKLSSYDATVFAFIDAMLNPLFESPLRTAAVSCQNLVDYHQRLRAKTPLPLLLEK